MEKFLTDVQIRWSDLDPNFHLRHSVYYDWGALSRINFLNKYGLTPALMQQLHFGPVLFREECLFKREIHLQDKVWIDLHLVKSRRDFSRWSIKHHIYKGDEEVAAILIVDGAWIDTHKRKLAIPPSEAKHVFEQMPRPADFTWEEIG